MKWDLRAKFAMPGVIALFLAAVLQRFIPPEYRSYVFGSVVLTLVLGLLTGQFRQMAQGRKNTESEQQDTQQSQSEHEGPAE